MSIRAKNVLFRADSSSKIGTGHIMRDLVLAERFKDANIIFATQALPGNINHKIKEKGYAVELLDSNGVEALDVLIKKYNITMVVIDHYGIDYAFEKKLKEHTSVKIMSLDDTYEKHYCDVLLNHNISADVSRYEGLVPEKCTLQCGPKYTLIRKEFKETKKRDRSIKRDGKIKLMVSMGGSDSTNLLPKIIDVLSGIDNIEFHILTTSANKNKIVLKEKIESTDNFFLHLDPQNMADLMNECDMGIITPSVIAHEAIYMNLPFIAIKTGEDQADIYHYFKKHKIPVLEHYEPTLLVKKLYEEFRKVSLE